MRTPGLTSYQRSPPPVIDPTNPAYIADELQRLEEVIGQMVLMAPQVATAAPPQVRDGMTRLARAPWRPIGGDVDRWVWWDAGLGRWQPFNGN